MRSNWSDNRCAPPYSAPDDPSLQVARTHTGHTDACDRQAETETLRSELKVIGVKKRQLEQDNDDLGRRERYVPCSARGEHTFF
jgi:hypothetical protein